MRGRRYTRLIGYNYSLEEIEAAIGKVTKGHVVYEQILVDGFKSRVIFGADLLFDGLSYFKEFGCFGTDTGDMVASKANDIRRKLTILEEFREKRQPKLS